MGSNKIAHQLQRSQRTHQGTHITYLPSPFMFSGKVMSTEVSTHHGGVLIRLSLKSRTTQRSEGKGGSPIHPLLVMVDQRSYLIFSEKGSENMLNKDCISLLYFVILSSLRNIPLEITLTTGNKEDFFLTVANRLQT